jgi:hypothetical protein
MFACIYICIHISWIFSRRINPILKVYIDTYKCKCIYAYAYVYVYVYIYIYMYIYMYVCKYCTVVEFISWIFSRRINPSLKVYIFTYIRMYMHALNTYLANVYIYRYMYIDIYINIYIHLLDIL